MSSSITRVEETDSLANLEERIARAVHLITQLRQERDNAIQRAQTVAGDVAAVRLEAEAAIAERDAAVRNLQAASSVQDEAKHELDRLTAERDAAAKQRDQLQAENSKLAEEIQHLRSERKQVRTRIEKLLGQMDLLGSGS